MGKVSLEDLSVPISLIIADWRYIRSPFETDVQKKIFFSGIKSQASHFCFGRFLWYIISVPKFLVQKLLEFELIHTCKNACRSKMKLSFVLLGASTTGFHTDREWMKRRYQVQNAFFSGQQIKLRAGVHVPERSAGWGRVKTSEPVIFEIQWPNHVR